MIEYVLSSGLKGRKSRYLGLRLFLYALVRAESPQADSFSYGRKERGVK